MKVRLTHFFLLCLAFLLASCLSNKGQMGAVGGAGAGAILGQAIGHNTEGTLIGAAAGGLLGYIVGNEMDKYDRQQLNNVYERGVSGRSVSWVNPQRGVRYQATPQPAYRGPGNQICRNAQVVSDSFTDSITSCRDGSGNWQIQ